ncbi:DUF735 family protein [Enterococcus sp. DIV1420a]|uniref:DUF735 family protein n=1 Tax=Enterococcus sp. DIV1420a TaxID=2774672 RepID=UPI003F225A0E
MVRKNEQLKEVEEVICFTKADLINSSAFSNVEQDFLMAILKEGEQYTLSDAKKILDKTLKGAVK